MSYQQPPDRETGTAAGPPLGGYQDNQAFDRWYLAQSGRHTQSTPRTRQEPQPPYAPRQPYGQQPPSNPYNQSAPGQWQELQPQPYQPNQGQPSYPQQQPYSQPPSTPGLQYGTPPGRPPYQGQPPYGQRAYQGQPYGPQPRSPSGDQSWPRRHKVLTVLGSLVVLIIFIGGMAGLGAKARQADNASAVATTTPTRTATHQAVSTKTVPAKAPVTTQAAASPPAAAAPAPAASTPAPAKTAPAAAPSRPAAMPSASCRPLSDEGSCYEPGEYCRYVDRGMSGVAGDGKAITCEDNDGWRWEPS